ncbi:MAG TPA: hypothetical protein VNI84_14570 [Pyrinomonadaceae bacterium]|nr:hypothetical protein [Pyrinomonadaceae bacterium]
MAKLRTWRPLSCEHKYELVALVIQAHHLANRTPSMRRLAIYLIKLVGWRWTADAVESSTGIVIPDAIKHNISYLPHTANAVSIINEYPKECSKSLTHEHVVPLGLLAEYIFSYELIDSNFVYEILNTYCKAAVITNEEDKILNRAKLRSSMPTGWHFGKEEVFARYNAVGIELIFPITN